MKIHQLELKPKKASKRLGRGIGSGHGKTAGRGTKGQNARSGGSLPIGFEGGQTKLAQRLPKLRGFKARNSINYQVVNVGDLIKLNKSKIDIVTLNEAGLVRKTNKPVKLLSDGKVAKSLDIIVQAASKSAIAKVEAAGGKVEIKPIEKKRVVKKSEQTDSITAKNLANKASVKKSDKK